MVVDVWLVYNLFEIAVEPHTYDFTYDLATFQFFYPFSFINYQQLKVEYKRVFWIIRAFTSRHEFISPFFPLNIRSLTPTLPPLPNPSAPSPPTHPPIPCIHVIKHPQSFLEGSRIVLDG
jgi:hypothetical protein